MKVHPTRHSAFSLVLSLTVMAMLLLLCIGAAALLTIELRVSRASGDLARARLNAMAAARIAFGELQRTLGPDQRVSATADILGDPAQTDPTQNSYYRSGTGNTITHPRWVGVWNSGRVADLAVADVSTAAGEKNKVLQRTSEGYLMDSRFAGGKDWSTSRADKTPGNASKRLLAWLVSGNEALAASSPESLTPFSPIDASKDSVTLGGGTLGALFKAGDTTTDALGARARNVVIPGADGTEIGSYAYWVADEGVKARINLNDAFEAAGIKPNAGTPGDGGYARLLIPQRNNFDIVKSSIPGAPALPTLAAKIHWDRVTSFNDLTLAAGAATEEKFAPYYFHDLSFHSAGVACDVVNGGLKKDLTAYLQHGAIADYAGAPGSGLADTAPFVAEPTLAAISPKFALLKSWSDNAPAYATSGVSPTGPATFDKTYNFSIKIATQNRQAVVQSYVGKVPDYANQTKAALAPVVTELTMFNKPIMDDTGVFKKAYQARIQIYPKIVLWNPYAVPLKIAALQMDYLNQWGSVPNFWNPASFTYVGVRQHIRYLFPANLSLAPGQCIVYVADRAANALPNPNGAETPAASAYQMRTVMMKEGLPTADTYYVDSLIRDTGSSNMLDLGKSGDPPLGSILPISPTTVQRRLYYVITDANQFPKTWPTFDDSKTPVSQLFVSDGATPLQQLNMDSYDGDLRNSTTRGVSVKAGLAANQPGAKLLSSEIPGVSPPDVLQQCGFRLKRLDASESAATGGVSATPTHRNININPFLDGNVRAARATRHPFDAADLISAPAIVQAGLWTGDDSFAFAPTGFLPGAANQYSPFVKPMDAAGFKTYPASMPYDVPYKEIGLLSLGQLRHAPLNTFSQGPSMPFANGRVPLPDTGGGLTGGMTNRTGVSRAELKAAWAAIGRWTNLDTQVRQTDRTGGAHDLYDIAFEQNTALWDAFWISGISKLNTGAQSLASAWENTPPSPGGSLDHTLPNSRYEQHIAGASASGYFSDNNYRLTKPAYTLLQKGAFNVNSTSKVAWKSLLASFRNLPVPTFDNPGGVTTSGSPFARHLRPKSKVAPDSTSGDASFKDEAWSGFRVLTDAELDLLADKIVAEVKKRGPFLSLGDFVNRRLKTPTNADYASWSTSEADYLGTLEAAITEARLNKQYDDTLMPRADADADIITVTNGSSYLAQIPRKPQHRAPHKVAGIPGYLEQGDILQQIAPVLSARSDTFSVRARGEHNGTVAWVQITVQRGTDPLVAGTGTTLPVNPKALDAGDPDAAFSGNQFFGRRMRIVAIRRLSDEEI